MNKKAYAKISKLRSELVKLRTRKEYVLSNIRKYPVEMQRAVVKGLWLKITEIERKIDVITAENANTNIAKDAMGNVVRTLPIGAGYEPPWRKTADAFGFWRADNNSLIKTFGAVDTDVTEYVDDMDLPNLFIGPFIKHGTENTDEMEYLVLLDEVLYDTGDGTLIKMMPEIAVKADKLCVRKADDIPDELAKNYRENKQAIECEMDRRIDAIEIFKGLIPGTAVAYRNYRKVYGEYAAEKFDKILDEKARKRVQKLKKKYGLYEEG